MRALKLTHLAGTYVAPNHSALELYDQGEDEDKAWDIILISSVWAVITITRPIPTCKGLGIVLIGFLHALRQRKGTKKKNASDDKKLR